MAYNIVRFYMNKPSKVIKRGLTLQEAKRHCSSPKTKGKNWFDGFRKA